MLWRTAEKNQTSMSIPAKPEEWGGWSASVKEGVRVSLIEKVMLEPGSKGDEECSCEGSEEAVQMPSGGVCWGTGRGLFADPKGQWG